MTTLGAARGKHESIGLVLLTSYAILGIILHATGQISLVGELIFLVTLLGFFYIVICHTGKSAVTNQAIKNAFVERVVLQYWTNLVEDSR